MNQKNPSVGYVRFKFPFYIRQKKRERERNFYHNKMWKILKEMGVPDYLTGLLRSLYVGQEATVSIGHGITDWFKIGKEVWQGCILSPCLFNFYRSGCWGGWITSWNQDCWEKYQQSQICRRYSLMAEKEEEPKSLLMRVKEESEKAGLKLNIQKKRRSWHLVPSHGNYMGEKKGSSDIFYFLGLQNNCG